MDNQFYQPGSQPGTGMPGVGDYGVPGPGVQGGDPFGQQPNPYGMPVAQPNPYDALQGGAAPYGTPAMQPNPYDALQGGAAPYGTPAMQPNPYDALQPGAAPYGAPAMQPNPYDTMQPGAAPYGAPAMQPNPYDTMQTGTVPAAAPVQTPYGGVAQPYADPGAAQAPYSADGYRHLFPQGQGDQAATEQTAPAPQVQPHGQPFAGASVPVTGQGKRRLTPSDIALIVVAMLAIIGFAGWYLYATYAPEAARYGRVATGSLSAIHSGSVLVVRNEIPYDAEGVNSVTYTAAEGSKIARNDVICSIYATGYSASAVRQLQQYRDELRDYQESLIEGSTIYDAKTVRYNADLLTLALEVRQLMAGDSGSLPNIEAQMTQQVAQRQLYFDQKYASDQRFSRMKDDERSQNQRISSWTHTYKATTDALVSFYSDGYEYVINGSNYLTFEPASVRAMIDGQKPAKAAPGKGKTTLYRMVKDNEWYALFLSDDTEWNPVNGETYELQLERFGDTPVQAIVVNFEKGGGELLVRLRIIGSVEQIMYLRTCDAVLSESMTTLMVNERAIYTQDEMTGVVVVEGSTESFIPVNVLHVVDGYAYFQTVQQGLIFEGTEVRLFD